MQSRGSGVQNRFLLVEFIEIWGVIGNDVLEQIGSTNPQAIDALQNFVNEVNRELSN